MMAIRTAALLGAAALLAAGCDNPDKPRAEASRPPAEAKATPPTPAPVPAPAAEPTGPGRIDSETLRAAATAQGVERVKLETEKDGSIRYLSVHHKDASALPAAVTRLLDTQYPGGKIVRYETEMVDKLGRLYEVEVETKDQQECEYSAKADGTLVYTECHIDPKALPEKIRTEVERDFPGAAIKEAEKKSVVGGDEEYEVEFESGGRLHELYFKADGTRFRHELVIPALVEVPA
jgi:hypothetical protein